MIHDPRHRIDLTLTLCPNAKSWTAGGTATLWDGQRMRGAGPVDSLTLPQRRAARPDDVLAELRSWVSITCWEHRWDALWEALQPWQQLELPYGSADPREAGGW